MSAEPSRTIKEPSKSKAREALCEILRPETADAFISHRKAKRAMLTDHAAVLIAKKLAGCSDPDAVVNDSIANGWTGVFPEKFKTATKPGGNHGKPDKLAAMLRGAAAPPMDRGPDRHPSQPLLAAGRSAGNP